MTTNLKQTFDQAILFASFDSYSNSQITSLQREAHKRGVKATYEEARAYLMESPFGVLLEKTFVDFVDVEEEEEETDEDEDDDPGGEDGFYELFMYIEFLYIEAMYIGGRPPPQSLRVYFCILTRETLTKKL